MNDQYQYQTQSQTGAGVAYDEGLRKFMLGVYNYMGLGLLATAIVAYAMMNNPELARAAQGTFFIPFIGIIAIGFIGPRFIYSSSPVVAHAIYWTYVALWGWLIGPTVASYTGAGMATEVYKAFFITATVFGSVSLYGYTTKKDLAPMGKFLFMAVVGLLIAIVLNFLIFKSGLMSFGISALVVIVFSALTAYETQMIKNMYHEQADNNRASIFGAFMLYGSFVTLFIHILNILGFMND